jgi:predicted  nucleic acid-binding Zn-ribbon protein
VSGSARPEHAAFAELDRLVRSLGEELAFFRRRALEAERRLRELVPETGAGHASGASPEALRSRISELEQENQTLRARLDEAVSRTRQMADRVRFLRQQQEVEGER